MKVFSPDVLYPFVYSCIHTGCRLSELLNLQWKQVDFSNGLLHINTGKTGKVRSLKMTDGLRILLSKVVRSCDFVFTRHGNRLSKTTYGTLLKIYKKQSKVDKDWTTHCLRRTFAYQFLRNGGSLYQLSAFLGHSSIKVTYDVYAQLQACDVELSQNPLLIMIELVQ